MSLALAGAVATLTTDGATSLWRIQEASRASLEAPSVLRQAVAALSSRHADRNGDGIVDAPAMDQAASPAPAGGGRVPAAIGAPLADPWGSPLGYCAWSNGPGSTPAGMIPGQATATGSETSFAVIGAGRDRSFATTCAHALAGTAQGDDQLRRFTLADVALATAGAGGSAAVSASTAVQALQAVCAAKGKLYAGTVQGADADGCIAAAGANTGVVTDAEGHLAVSCLHVSQLINNPSNGEYLLLGVPSDGSLPLTYVTRCEYTTNGGKWTLAAKYDPAAPCPTGMKAGAVCTTPAQGIDLFDYSRMTTDLASPRATTGALRYLKSWHELLFKDGSGGWSAWDCGGISPTASFGQQFVEAQSLWPPGVTCAMSATSHAIALNPMLPRLRVNLTGFRQMTSLAWAYNSCPPFTSCWWDATVRTTTVRDSAGYNGRYYFSHESYGFALLPALNAAGGSADANYRVCPNAPVGSPDFMLPFGGTLTNGCRAAWTQQFRGPWALNAGPHRPWDYSTDFPGDVSNRVPLLAHLAPQPRPDEIWAPNIALRINAASAGNGGGMHHQFYNAAGAAETANDICRFGYPTDGGTNTVAGPGLFFIPNPAGGRTSFVYGSGTLDGVGLGFTGEWLDPYGMWFFSGGTGLLEAVVGPISMKTAMIPGGAGQAICIRNLATAFSHMVNGDQCIFDQWRDMHHQGSGAGLFDPCTFSRMRFKIEVPFAQMPTNVPLALFRSYLPVDIREIWLR